MDTDATDPSAGAATDEIFFSTPQLEQRLDLLEHLLEHGDQIVLLGAPPGAGRTTFLDELARRAPARWRVARLNASPGTDATALVAALAQALEIAPSGDDVEAVLARVQERIATLAQSDELAVLLVDDAHLLDPGVLEPLLRLSRPPARHARLRTVLCGDPETADRLSSAGGGDAFVHHLDLPRLGEAQTRAFLEGVLIPRGLLAPEDVDERLAARVHGHAAGLAGRILQATARSLADGDMPGGVAPRRPGTRRIALAAAVAGVAVLAGLVLWLLQPPETAEAPPAAVELPPPRAEAPPRPAPPPPEPAEPAPTRPAETAPDDTDAPAAERAADTRAPAPPAASTRPATPEPAASAAAAPEATPGTRDAQWLAEQDPDHYVLQLFGVHDRSAAVGFVESHAAIEELAWFTTRHRARPWYVVCYGVYPDRERALAAIGTLPAALREFEPWARSIASVREAMAAAEP